METFTPHKLLSSAEVKVSPEQFDQIRAHTAIVKAIYDAGEFASAGGHFAVNCCGNYVAALLEMASVGTNLPQSVRGPKPYAHGPQSPLNERMSEQSLDELERRMIEAIGVAGGKFFKPATERDTFQNVYADGDQILDEGKLGKHVEVSIDEAYELAHQGIQHKNLSLPRGDKPNLRASFFEQYRGQHRPDSNEDAIDKLVVRAVVRKFQYSGAE